MTILALLKGKKKIAAIWSQRVEQTCTTTFISVFFDNRVKDVIKPKKSMFLTLGYMHEGYKYIMKHQSKERSRFSPAACLLCHCSI